MAREFDQFKARSGRAGETGLVADDGSTHQATAAERFVHMTTVLFHFAAGTLGALAVFLLFVRLSGETGFSAPFGVVFFGICCAALAHFLSPWTTPVLLVVYAAASAAEYLQDRKARKAARNSGASNE